MYVYTFYIYMQVCIYGFISYIYETEVRSEGWLLEKGRVTRRSVWWVMIANKSHQVKVKVT